MTYFENLLDDILQLIPTKADSKTAWGTTENNNSNSNISDLTVQTTEPDVALLSSVLLSNEDGCEV